MTKEEIQKLRETAERAEHREWYADRRHITLCRDKQAMGASLPTNHIAVFADAEDAAHAAAANPQTVLALLDEIDRAKQFAREACDIAWRRARNEFPPTDSDRLVEIHQECTP